MGAEGHLSRGLRKGVSRGKILFSLLLLCCLSPLVSPIARHLRAQAELFLHMREVLFWSRDEKLFFVNGHNYYLHLLAVARRVRPEDKLIMVVPLRQAFWQKANFHLYPRKIEFVDIEKSEEMESLLAESDFLAMYGDQLDRFDNRQLELLEKVHYKTCPVAGRKCQPVSGAYGYIFRVR